MIHAPINTGDGWRCNRCGLNWDQGEPEPPDCLPTPAARGTQPLGPIEPTLRRLQTMSTPDPMLRQAGGWHYKKLAIQPTEFCMRNGLDACVHGILKYLVRWRVKGGIVDLEKAIHYAEIRLKFVDDLPPFRKAVINMFEFNARNDLPELEREALYRLESWYRLDPASTYGTAAGQQVAATRVISAIKAIIENEQASEKDA